MHETILKAFGFFKSFTQFMKIVVVFCILMLLMYWISNLAGYNWAWLGFISPLLDSFINVGAIPLRLLYLGHLYKISLQFLVL